MATLPQAKTLPPFNQAAPVSTQIFSVDPATQGAPSAGACTNGHEIDTATIVISSVKSHANQPVQSLNGPTWNASVNSSAVTCNVDMDNDTPYGSVNNVSRLVTEPVHATAAAASWPLLTEGYYPDSSLETLLNMAEEQYRRSLRVQQLAESD
ncbi:hypothetical protein K432DRAFT_404407 [Lepidopterella palustris CBS 459.81]|uniref:Uncharacterized protein n=1 Tax=Lepidopterella palustris CBS 459.81 TaxID=1314670 RepID=A0A8E2EBC6_9PEZI|nr:hypothetical protein K432DRAFT_404407 [Lepidopterella palustris CBS 459.81]